MRKFLTLAAAAAAVLVSGAAQATPYLVLTLEATGFGAETRTCSTFSAATSALCAANGFLVIAPDNIRYIAGTIGGFTGKIQGASSNVPGSAAEAFVDMSFEGLRNVSAGALATFRLTGTAFGFTLPAGPGMTLFGSQANSSNGDPGSSMTSVYYANPSNVNPIGAGDSISTSCTRILSTADSCNAPMANWMRGAGDFSLADQITFGLTQGSLGVNGSSNVIVRNRVPEPMTTALVGLGLFGAAFFSRRRKAVTA